MNPNSWAGAVNVVKALNLQAVTGATSGTSIDTTNYTGTALFVLDSAAGTSTSLTTNGTFDEDSGWTKGTGWTINTGTYTADFAGHSASSDLKQNQTLTAANYYTVTYTISGYSAGSITVKLGGTSGTARSADGTYTETILCGAGTDPKLVFTATSTFRGSIDGVSVIAAKLVSKIQESIDDSDWTDVTGATFSNIYGIAAQPTCKVNLDACARYVKILTAPSGDSASFTCTCNMIALTGTT